MEHNVNSTIETERLLLVPTTEEHTEEIFKEFTDEITKYMAPKTATDIQETQQWIQSCIPKRAAGEELQMTILDKTTKEFLGNVGLHRIKEAIPELGIRIKKTAHGKKIGREAVAGLENRAKKNLSFEYILYPVDKDNIGSRKIAEALGGKVEVDKDGKEIVHTKDTLDPNRKLNAVEYRIPKKITLPQGFQLSNNISDEEYAQMIAIMEANDLSRYIITKDGFSIIKNEKNEIIAFGRIFEIGPKKSELGSLRVHENYRGQKLGLLISQEIIKNKHKDTELYLATKNELGKYYEKIGFKIITEHIPEKLIYTGKWAQEKRNRFYNYEVR